MMTIDCHIHSPSLMVGWPDRWALRGMTKEQLKFVMKAKEEEFNQMHGGFWGPHYAELLPSRPNDNYLRERVLPMLENHTIQLIGVTTWRDLDILRKLEKAETQIEGIELIVSAGGLAIIDQPRAVYKTAKETNKVYVGHRGEATVRELKGLPQNARARTFLCASSMVPASWQERAYKAAQETGLMTIGGSDTMMSQKSLFTGCSLVNASGMTDLLEHPNAVLQTQSGSAAWYERLRRYACAAIEEARGLRWRQAREERQLKYWIAKTL